MEMSEWTILSSYFLKTSFVSSVSTCNSTLIKACEVKTEFVAAMIINGRDAVWYNRGIFDVAMDLAACIMREHE